MAHLPISRRIRIEVTLAIVGLASAQVGPAESRVLVVDPANGPFTRIQRAVSSAADGDTVLVHPGLFLERIECRVSITVVSRDGPTTTVLDGEGEHGLLTTTDATVEVRGFTFRNGRAELGGAIHGQRGAVRIADCRFVENRAALGGAIYVQSGALQVDSSTFIGNTATGTNSSRVLGEAILLGGENAQLAVTGCTFFDGRSGGYDDGVIGYDYFIENDCVIGEWPEPCEEPPFAASVTVRNSTFIDVVSPPTYPIYATNYCRLVVNSCLFQSVDGRASIVSPTPSRSISNNMVWNGSSPHLAPVPVDSREFEELADDPMFCEPGSAAVHARSRAVRTPGAPIGTGEIGCQGLRAWRVFPDRLSANAGQMVQIVAFGWDETTTATLRGSDGREAVGAPLQKSGTHASYAFDLSGWESGIASIVLRNPGGDSAILENIRVETESVHGIFPTRLPEAGPKSFRIAGPGVRRVTSAVLRRTSPLTVVPLELGERVADDSLAATAGEIPPGVYALVVTYDGSYNDTIPGAFQLGTPQSFRVPADYATIGEALREVPEGAEILVDPGVYSESLSMDRPVRLRATGGWWETTLKPDASGGRVVNILRTAGPLAEIVGFGIRNGNVVDEGGAGVFADCAALLAQNWFQDNRCSGRGALGGALLATGGIRLFGNTFVSNEARGSFPRGRNPFLPSATDGGIGGAFYGRDCLLVENHFWGNGAQSCGNLVATGTMFRNEIRDGWAHDQHLESAIGSAAASGRIAANIFNNDCAGGTPFVYITGSSSVTENVFRSIVWDLCYPAGEAWFSGPMQIERNTFIATSPRVCARAAKTTPDPSLTFSSNIVAWAWSAGQIFVGNDECALSPTLETERIPLEAVRIRCNLGPVSLFVGGGEQECPPCAYVAEARFCAEPTPSEYSYEGDFDYRQKLDSPALPENNPLGCTEIIGAYPAGCELNPVLVSGVEFRPEGSALRVRFRLSTDVAIEGWRASRVTDVEETTLSTALEPACARCEFIDPRPDGGRNEYWITFVDVRGDAQRVSLGVYEGAALIPSGVVMETPFPHPVGRSATWRFGLPASHRALKLELFDASGRRVANLDLGSRSAGWHRVEWAPRDASGRFLASGVYFARLVGVGASVTRRLAILGR